MPHVLFEEDGAFKAGTVLGGTDASYQVELASGKRGKIKAAHVLLRFEEPAPGQLLVDAQRAAQDIDIDFLWECAPQEEFGFEDLAREYHGHAASAVEAASILLRLHGAPVYFQRKGRGRFRPAPPDVLKAALAAVERKRQQELLKQRYVAELAAGRVPDEIARQAIDLIVAPDRNGIEYKALGQAAQDAHCTPQRLLLKLGAIASAYRWHVDSFNRIAFPRGAGFAPGLAVAAAPDAWREWPMIDARIVSVDDSATTEIDDGFSLQMIGAVARVGIHIAAPAAAIGRGDALDAVARARMSTVYAPGLKYTMLPRSAIGAFSLDAGHTVPVVSLYVDVDAQSLEIRAKHTRLERARIEANLRHDQLDELITEARLVAGDEIPHKELLGFMWRFAGKLRAGREAARGKPEPRNRVDYSIVLDGEGEAARVSVHARARGAPLDLIVSELAILANSAWGEWLAREGRVAIYRSQALGRVKMGTRPAPHEGLGVSHYAWCTSPLRRYVDLINQRQLIAAVAGAAAVYATNDAEVFAAVSGFDAAYELYNDFQDRMERYWCLRWLRQHEVTRIAATVLKDEVIRLDGLPFVTRMPGLPVLARGRRVEVDILGADEVETSLQLRLHRVLDEAAAVPAEEDEEIEEVKKVEAADADANATATTDANESSAASSAPSMPPLN
jgi:exoribonuclease-2